MKLKLFIAPLLLSAALVSLPACSQSKSVTGEMHYTNYGTEYGIRVNVEVQGDRIKSVKVVDSDYVEASEPMGSWDPQVWNSGLSGLLAAYRGKYVSDVLAKEVVTDEKGAPLTSEDTGFNDYGDDFMITGATLGSGRLLIAVQTALKKL